MTAWLHIASIQVGILLQIVEAWGFLRLNDVWFYVFKFMTSAVSPSKVQMHLQRRDLIIFLFCWTGQRYCSQTFSHIHSVCSGALIWWNSAKPQTCALHPLVRCRPGTELAEYLCLLCLGLVYTDMLMFVDLNMN